MYIFIFIIPFILNCNIFCDKDSDDVDRQIELYQKLYNPANVKKMFKKGVDIHNGKGTDPAKTPPKGSIDDQILKLLKDKVKKKKKTDPFLWWHKSKFYIFIGFGVIILIIVLIMLVKYFKQMKYFFEHLFMKKMSKANVQSGERQYEQGNIRESIKFYKRGMVALVNNQDALENYISALVENNDISEAITSLQILEKNFSLSKDHMLLLVKLYIKTNNTNKALDLLDTLFLKSYKDYDILFEIKKYYRKLNNTFNLTDCIKKLLDFKPNNVDLLLELGSLYTERNMLAEAISVFEHIKDIDRSDVGSYLKISEINLMLNNESRAIEELENAFEHIRSFHKGVFDLLNKIIEKNCKNVDAKIMLTRMLYLKDPSSQKLNFLYKELIITQRTEELIEKGYKYFNNIDHPEEMITLFEKLVEITREPPAFWAPFLIPLCIEFGNNNLFLDYWNKLELLVVQPEAFDHIKDSMELCNFFDEKIRCLILSKIFQNYDTEKFLKYCSTLVSLDPLASEEMSFSYFLLQYKPELYASTVEKLYNNDKDNNKWLFLRMIYSTEYDKIILPFFESISSLEQSDFFFKEFQCTPLLNTDIEYQFALKFFEFGAKEKAVSLLNDLGERVNDTQKIRYTLSKYYLAMDKTSKANEIIGKLIENYPENMKYRKVMIQLESANGNSLNTEKHINKILMNDEFDKYKLFVKNILKRMLGQKSDDSNLLRQLGLLYYRSGSYFKGFLFMDEAIKNDPASLEKILTFFKEFPPKTAEPFMYYLKLLLHDDSKLDFGMKLIETSAKSIFAERTDELSLIKSEFLLALDANSSALSEIKKVNLNNLSKDLIISGMKLKAKILGANNKKKQALEILDDLESKFGSEVDIGLTRTTLSKELYETLYKDGMTYFRDKEWNKAISKFQKFLHNNSDSDFDIRIALSICFFEKSFYDLALDELEFIGNSLKNISPPDLEMHYKIADIYFEYGYFREAFNSFKIILGHDFDFKDVSEKIEKLKTEISSKGTNEGNSALISHITADIEDRYSRFEIIGKGGTSLVFKAYDNKLDRNVAIKVLNEEHIHDKEELKRFKRSAMAVAKFNHPNITRIYDIEESENSSYLIMEIIEGPNLRELMAENNLTFNEKIRILTQIAQALNYAHSYGIIHRDIKPENVTIEKESQLVKVMDFGLARIEYMSTMTKTGIKMGTPYYMSPEQIKGESVAVQSDIYSFGILAYEMLTGKRPFTSGDLAYQHIHLTPTLPSEINPNIGVALENVIIRCIQKIPLQRFENAGLLYESLRKLKAGTD